MGREGIGPSVQVQPVYNRPWRPRHNDRPLRVVEGLQPSKGLRPPSSREEPLQKRRRPPLELPGRPSRDRSLSNDALGTILQVPTRGLLTDCAIAAGICGMAEDSLHGC